MEEKEKIINAAICSFHRLKKEGKTMMITDTWLTVFGAQGYSMCRLSYIENIEKRITKTFLNIPYEWETYTDITCLAYVLSEDRKHIFEFYEGFEDNIALAHKVRDFIKAEYEIHIAEEEAKEQLKKAERILVLDKLNECNQ